MSLRGNVLSSLTATYVLRPPQFFPILFTRLPVPPLFLYLLPRTYSNSWLPTEPSHRLHPRIHLNPPHRLFQRQRRPLSLQQNPVPHPHPMKTTTCLENGHGRT